MSLYSQYVYTQFTNMEPVLFAYTMTSCKLQLKAVSGRQKTLTIVELWTGNQSLVEGSNLSWIQVSQLRLSLRDSILFQR